MKMTPPSNAERDRRTVDEAVVSKGAQTRQAILVVAIERFGRDGYRATSVADIARGAGVSGTLAYAYFPNKEALFLAAVDEDAAAVIREGLADALGGSASPSMEDWRQGLLFSLVGALDGHPLARRLLGGLEPEVTTRVLEIPALAEMRKAVAERIRSEQIDGTARPDVDAQELADGVVAIVLSLLMSVVQIGPDAARTYADAVTLVFEAALRNPAR